MTSSPQYARTDAEHFPSFSNCFKSAWKGFTSNFWKIIVIEAVFTAAALFLQYLFFGSVALSIFAEALQKGSIAGNVSGSVSTLLSVTNATLVVATPALLLLLLVEVAHQGALLTLAARGQGTNLRLTAILRQGVKMAWRVAIILLCLFVAVALMNAVLALLTALVHRYTGQVDDSTTAMINRFFLLIFAVGLLVELIVYALTGFALGEARVSVWRALKLGFNLWRRAWWSITSRAFLAALVLYGTHEVAGNITLSFGNISAQSIVSFFFIPFALFFMHELYRAAAMKSPHPLTTQQRGLEGAVSMIS